MPTTTAPVPPEENNKSDSQAFLDAFTTVFNYSQNPVHDDDDSEIEAQAFLDGFITMFINSLD